MGLAEALARFAYVQTHQAETSGADRQKAARDLASRVREEGPLNSMSGPSGLGATAGIPRIDVTPNLDGCPPNVEHQRLTHRKS